MAAPPNRQHTQEVKDRAIALYFQMEQHFEVHKAVGGGGMRLQEIAAFLGLKSNSTTLVYVGILEKWGLVKRIPNSVGTIVPIKPKNYPAIEYKELDNDE